MKRIEELPPTLRAVTSRARLNNAVAVNGHLGSLPGDVIASEHINMSRGHGPSEPLGHFVGADMLGAFAGVHVYSEEVHPVCVVGVYLF